MPTDFERIQRLYSSDLARRADLNGISALSRPERNVLLTWWAKGEIDNGGFALLHAAPLNIEEIAQAFDEIGVSEAADACRKSILAFGEKYPADLETRIKVIDSINDPAVGKDPWHDVDRLVWNLGDEFEKRIAEYIQKHKQSFSEGYLAQS